MEQASSLPSAAVCELLLNELPAMNAFRRVVHRVAPEESRGWLRPLGVISRHADGVRLSAISDILHVDLSVVSRQVSALQELELVERLPDPADGRASILKATPRGANVVAQLKVRFAERVRTYLVDWSDEDVANLTGLLHRFGKSMEAVEHRTDAAAVEPLDLNFEGSPTNA